MYVYVEIVSRSQKLWVSNPCRVIRLVIPYFQCVCLPYFKSLFSTRPVYHVPFHRMLFRGMKTEKHVRTAIE